MDDGRTDLTFYVISDHGQMRLFEAFLPIPFTSNKDRDTVDEPHSGLKNLLDIPFGSIFRADRQIVHHDISTGVFENSHDIVSLSLCFGDDTREILPESIMRHTAIHLRIEFGNVCEAIRIVWGCIDGLTDIFTYFILVNIKGDRELDIVDVVPTKVDVHQARHEILWLRLTVVVDALYKRTGTVASTNERNAHFLCACHVEGSFPK